MCSFNLFNGRLLNVWKHKDLNGIWWSICKETKIKEVTDFKFTEAYRTQKGIC
jgi:hypothetical protein